jgi:preprotein translocase subunit SecD
MLQVAPWRIILVSIVAFFGFLFAFPNAIPEDAREDLPGFLPRAAVNLGLDLQGGSYLLLEIDVPTLRHQQLENIADSMGQALRDAEPAIRYTGRGVVADVARVRLVNEADADRALAALRPLIETVAGQANLEFSRGADGLMEARMSERALRELSRQAAAQSIEVIRRRIDPTGTSEVSIVRQGDERIVVQAPGMSDPELLRERIGKTALMTFHLVNEDYDQAELAAGRVPPGHIVAPPYPTIGNTTEVVRRRPSLTGEHLTRAAPSTDPTTGRYVLSFAHGHVYPGQSGARNDTSNDS